MRLKIILRTLILIAAIAILSLHVWAATDIIPCAVGNKWEFDCYKMFTGNLMFKGKAMSSMSDTSFGSSVYEVLSVDSASGQPVYEYREVTQTTSSTSGEETRNQSDLKIRDDSKGQFILSTDESGTNSDTPNKQDYDPPLFYYPHDAAPGKEWTVGSMRDENTTVPMTAKAVGRETVTVPAGTFKDCLKVVYISDTMTGTADLWGKQFTVTSGRSRGIYWIADGIGVVKELEVSTSIAETPGPDGTPMTIESSSASVSELKPGYVVKK